MDILHVNNQASVAYLLSRAQREMGHRSDLLAVSNPMQETPDTSAGGIADIFLKVMRLAPKYDLVHVHGGIGISGLALYPYKLFGKRFFSHYHGSELREGKQTSFHSVAERIFVSTPDLLALRSKVGGREMVHVPNPVDIDHITVLDYKARLEELEKGEPLRIAHMPSLRSVKGTDNVVRSVEEANKAGCNMVLDIIEKAPHDEALARLSQAHLCVDWMSPEFRIYGVVSIEAMARGIPTVCNIDTSLYTPGVPIVPAGPKDLTKVLIGLVQDVSRLENISKMSIEYARSNHSPKHCAGIIERYL
jgi:glycosyltransferase involved in cell wall biosynthesis